MTDDQSLSRRVLLKAIGLGGVVALPSSETTAAVPTDHHLAHKTFTTTTTKTQTSTIETGPRVSITQIAANLTAPIGFETAPESTDRRFIVDQDGHIYVHGPNGLESDPFLDISDQLVDLRTDFDERGLLGLSFHPDFSTNRKFYVRYSASSRSGTPDNYDHTFVLAEFEATEDLSQGDPTSERTLIEIPEPQFNHNAGAIAFGPDGYLYIGVGDGGNANDEGTGHVTDWYDTNAGGNGQDVTENLLGSILRIDVDTRDGDKPYGIPADNPLVGTDGLDEHYAWGFRNPWRMSFDDQGRLFVADVGQNLYEEVNLVEKGNNYGWNIREGTHCFSTDTPNDPPDSCPTTTPETVRNGESLTDPIIEYPHSSNGQTIGIAVIGGHFYKSGALSKLDQKYVFGDWSRQFGTPDGRLFAATAPTEDGLWSIETLRIADTQNEELNRYVLGFGQDDSGELYVLTTEQAGPTGNTGTVYKLTEPGPVETLELGGKVAGWTGQTPVTITNTTNPALELVAGTKYEIKWENLDGVTHDFQILDNQDAVLEETADVSQQGETASLTFTASTDMARYRCSFHPSSMRGTINIKSDYKTIDEAIAGSDDQIEISEIQQAIKYWANNEVVPETGGKTIELSKLQQLIQTWASGG